MAITLADFNKIWASTSPLTPYSFSEANYKQGWNFIGSTPPARQMWDFLQKNNDEKMQYLANNYLPLSGGTMTGAIKRNGWVTVVEAINTSSVLEFDAYPKSTSQTVDGASILLFGKDHGGAGRFDINANNGSGNKLLRGSADGTLTWVGQNILTASNYNTYALPLSGGTLTGDIYGNKSNNYFNIDSANTTSRVALIAGTGGASVSVYGKNWDGSYLGSVSMIADDGVNSKTLLCKPDGTLTWDGQPIQTSSDKRLKQDFSNVPDEVLEAWGKVEWQQFKYKADVERKGDSCRFHTGLVAQDVKEIGEANNVDLLKYGILCHDVREAVEEEKDEDGNIIREASESVDLWTVRYEEALAMEVIYLRNEIKKLREEIKALRTE